MGRGFSVAIVGATGVVGQEILQVLKERNFPIANLRMLASSRSEGKKLNYWNEELTVHTAKPEAFEGIELAFFAGGPVSKELVPEAVKKGAVAIDNSSAFRLEPSVPLVVPEVNPEDVEIHRGIIANPNCSTIIMVVPLKPLHDAGRIKRIIVSTYQAVSGAGKEAIDELLTQTKQVLAGEPVQPKVFPYQIAFNVIPHIDVFWDNGYSKEEMKMVLETQKILHEEEIKISATTVRVPVIRSHSESIYVETEKELTTDEVREILLKAPGVFLEDDLAGLKYPMPLFTTKRDEVFVGRIRKDLSHKNAFDLWVAADQLRKGAATNAVQIAELLIKRNLM